MQDFLPLERPSDVFFYTSFRGSFFEPRLHLSFETAILLDDRRGFDRGASQIVGKATDDALLVMGPLYQDAMALPQTLDNHPRPGDNSAFPSPTSKEPIMAKREGVNKSKAIRDYYKSHKKAKPLEVVEALCQARASRPLPTM